MEILTGFTTILAVVGCGFALAGAGLLDNRSQRALTDVAYLVATPALMLVTISDIGPTIAGTSTATAAVCLLVRSCEVFEG